MKKISGLVIFYFMLTISVVYCVFLRLDQREISKMENRTLMVRGDLKDGFSNEDIIDLVNDQFPMRDSLITIKNKTDLVRSDILGGLYNFEGYTVLQKVGSFYRINNSDYYVEGIMNVTPEKEKLFNNRIWNFEQIYYKYGDKYKLYIYKPSQIEEYDWCIGSNTDSLNGNELYNIFYSSLSDMYTISRQEFSSVDDYMKQHYKTDHHWNSNGFYNGYRQIINMIAEDFDIAKPYEVEECVNEGIPFHGSLSLKANGIFGCDDFVTYKLKDNIELVTFVNGNKENNGNRSILANADDNPLEHYLYEDYYGENVPIVEYYNVSLDDSYPSLLVFVDSFSNAINEDIAKHFKHTYFVDPRYWVGDDDMYNTHFDTDEFLSTHNIDAILWLQYYESLYFDSRMYMHIDLDY